MDVLGGLFNLILSMPVMQSVAMRYNEKRIRVELRVPSDTLLEAARYKARMRRPVGRIAIPFWLKITNQSFARNEQVKKAYVLFRSPEGMLKKRIASVPVVDFQSNSPIDVSIEAQGSSPPLRVWAWGGYTDRLLRHLNNKASYEAVLVIELAGGINRRHYQPVPAGWIWYTKPSLDGDE